VYEDETELWPDKLYPYRVRIKPYRKYFERPARSVIDKLDFIKNKQNWGIYLMGVEMKQLSKEQFIKIVED